MFHMRFMWHKLFDKYSIFHWLFSAILAFIFGMFPAWFFGGYYDISQSFMPMTSDRPTWTWTEKMLFTSNQLTDGYDIFLWNLTGAMFGAWIRWHFLGWGFYGIFGA